MKSICEKMRLPRGLAALAIGLLVAVAPANATHRSDNLAERLERDGRFTTLLAAAGAAGLGEALTAGGPFTLFAPTDEAFAKLPPGTVESLLVNTNALRDILLYHVLGEPQRAGELIYKRSVETLQGSEVTVSLRHGQVFVNDSRVINANVRAANGVIHVIDAVMLPSVR